MLQPLLIIGALIALFILATLMPKLAERYRLWSMKKFYFSLRDDIIRHATANNAPAYRVAIAQFQNEYTPGCSAYTTLLYEYLEMAVVASVEVDFKKELGI